VLSVLYEQAGPEYNSSSSSSSTQCWRIRFTFSFELKKTHNFDKFVCQVTSPTDWLSFAYNNGKDSKFNDVTLLPPSFVPALQNGDVNYWRRGYPT